MSSHKAVVAERDRRRERRLTWALIANAAVVVGQVAAAIIATSLGLLADAGHNLIDVVGVIIALVAIRYAQRAATAERSFGLHRATILAALANSATILAVTVFIVVEGVRRIVNPEPVDGGIVLGVALAAAVVNGVSALWVHEPHGHDLNIQATVLHLASDAFASVAIAVAGLIIWVTAGNYWLDPVASLIVAVLICVQALRLLRRSVEVLLEASPAGLDLPALVATMRGTAGVVDVHDLHVWSLSSEVHAMSAHLVVAGHPSLEEAQAIAEHVKTAIAEHHGIAHATLEMECEVCEEPDTCAVFGLPIEQAGLQ
jgi:cobalt-zinc-cadmium efflux system protein